MADVLKQFRRGILHPLTCIFLLELLLYLIPYSIGYPLIYGDNLNQNLPLRELSGNIFATGHLPSWDIFNWAGEPLLAGFNAGVFFPLTWLFIVFSAPLAMSLNLALTFFMASAGVYFIVKHLGGSKFASSASALVFTLTGQFVSQSVHIDMIEGIASSIWMLYFVFKFFDAISLRVRIRNAVLIGVSFALAVLAGAPEAMIDGILMVGAVSFVLFLKAPKKMQVISLLALAGAVALTLSGVQWIPGLLFETLSNRAKTSANYFEAGPYAPYYMPTFVTPFLLGNYGFLGIKSYFSSYNLAEISTYLPPLVSVVGIGALLSRRLRTTSNTNRIALLVAGTLGLILALGTYLAPFEYVMAHVPLYNLQRLPSRNMFVVDLMITLGFGISIDSVRSTVAAKWSMREHSFTVLTWISIAFLASTLAATILLIVSKTSLFQLLHVPPPYPTHLFSLKIMVLVETLLSIFSLGSLLLSMHYDKFRKTFLVNFALAIGAFQLIAFGTQTLYGQIPLSGPYANSTTFTRYSSKLPLNQRSVIFDPYLFYYSSLLNVGLPDLNYLTGQLSAQGYASLGIASFNQITDSKVQASFNPYIIDTIGAKYLNISRLISGSKYFLTREPAPLNPTNGQPAISFPQPKARVTIGSGKVFSHLSFYLGSPIKVNYIGVKVPNSVPLSCIKSAYVTSSLGKSPLAQRFTQGRYVFFVSTLSPPLSSQVTLNTCDALPAINGAPAVPVVIDSGSSLFRLDGWLAHVVTPKLFSYGPGPNQLSIFSFRSPHSSLIKAPSFATVKNARQNLDGTITFTSKSPRPYIAVVSQAYTKGWHVQLRSRAKGNSSTSVGQYNALQTIAVPAGNISVSDSYNPPGLKTGGALSFIGALGAILLLWGTKRYKTSSTSRP